MSLASQPWSHFYEASGVADHLPGDLFFHGVLAVMADRAGLLGDSQTYFVLLKSCAVLFDLCLLLTVFWWARTSSRGGLGPALR